MPPSVDEHPDTNPVTRIVQASLSELIPGWRSGGAGVIRGSAETAGPAGHSSMACVPVTKRRILAPRLQTFRLEREISSGNVFRHPPEYAAEHSLKFER